MSESSFSIEQDDEIDEEQDDPVVISGLRLGRDGFLSSFWGRLMLGLCRWRGFSDLGIVKGKSSRPKNEGIFQKAWDWDYIYFEAY